ncbi:MAG TPA: motility protein A [Chloroflexi bacterium]|jgi:chemotaxis protein MotA|nr:motility protein A [Chloroflexota bacterium]
MELSTIIGLVIALFSLVVGLILGGGVVQKLFDPGSLLIVFGGTFGTLFISYPLKAVLGLPRVVSLSIKKPGINYQDAIDLLVNLAQRARRDGLLTLEESVRSLDDEFLRKGLMLVIDGIDSSTVRDILQTDLEMMGERHQTGISMLESMGSFSPAMGLIGTVMGLVNALGNMTDPDVLAAAVSVAFLTTLWGCFASNVLWIPLANKLRANDEAEDSVRRLMIEGILGIQAGQSPRIVREKLEAFLAPEARAGEMGE